MDSNVKKMSYLPPDEGEILRHILSYTSQRKSANELSDSLMKSFGSLSAVLEAPPDLLEDTGVSSSAGAFLNIIPSLCRYYKSESCVKIGDTLNIKKLQQYMTFRFIGFNVEKVIIMLLDDKNKVLNISQIGSGGINGVSLLIPDIINLVLRHSAKKLVIAHNHPSGNAAPSDRDIQITNSLVRSLELINAELVDHIVVADESCLSFRSAELICDTQ